MNAIASAKPKTLSAQYRLTALIVGALGVSTILYIGIGWFFAAAMQPGEYPWLSNNTLAVTVLVMVLMMLFLRRFLLSPTRLQLAAQKGAGAILHSFYLASLLGAVLGDLLGIIGVVASLLTGVREFSWRLGLAALLMIAYSFPRRNEWERIINWAEAEKNSDYPAQSDNLPADAVRLGLTDAE